MSNWIKIKDPDDIFYDLDDDTLNIWASVDYNGNNYYVVPIDLIIKELEKNGYSITRSKETNKD